MIEIILLPLFVVVLWGRGRAVGVFLAIFFISSIGVVSSSAISSSMALFNRSFLNCNGFLNDFIFHEWSLLLVN